MQPIVVPGGNSVRGIIKVTGQIIEEVAQMILKHPDQLDLYEHFANLTGFLKELLEAVLKEKISSIDTVHFLMEQVEEIKSFIAELRNYMQQTEHGGNNTIKE